MEPAQQRALFADFLKKAVAEYSFTGGNLTLFLGPAPAFARFEPQSMWGHVTNIDLQRFELLLGTPAHGKGFFSLSPEQCEAALNELIQNSALVPGVSLLQSVNISKWLIDGQPVATQSQITLYYGMSSRISTFLLFETTSQFDFIKRVLLDLQFCKLSEKHLKPVKQGLKKKV